MSILKDIVAGVTGPFADIWKRRMEIRAQDRQQERALKQAIAERQIELVKEGRHADATWELESLKAHTDGWKDEAVLIVLLIPLVLVFIPHFAPDVLKGFEILQQTPLWYRWMIVSIFFAIYGIRARRRWLSDT